MAHEHQNYECLNYSYIDCYGNIHDEYQPYPNEDSRCYDIMISRHKIPKYNRIQTSFQGRKLCYQQAKLDLEVERKLEKMKYQTSSLPADDNHHMFQNVPSYNNKRVLRKLRAMEIKLQEQFQQHIQAEKERQSHSRKLHLVNKQDGYHRTKSNIEKKLSDNITENVWKEKELIRNKQKINKLRQ